MIKDKQQLNDLFEYKDGAIYWKQKPAKQIAAGTRAGCLSSDGYRYVRILGDLHAEHRVIYMMFNEVIGRLELIDHIDQNPLNNNLENLRKSNHAQNLSNRGKQVNNTSGYKGVILDKRDGKWNARIVVNKKSFALGAYKTPELASEAYKRAAIIHHGEFANY